MTPPRYQTTVKTPLPVVLDIKHNKLKTVKYHLISLEKLCGRSQCFALAPKSINPTRNLLANPYTLN